MEESTSAVCARCGRSVPIAGELCASCRADETGVTPPPESDATRIVPAPVVGGIPPSRKASADHRSLGEGGQPAEDDATRVGPPPAAAESDATSLGPPPGADATRLGAPADADATSLSSARPAAPAPPSAPTVHGSLHVGDTFGRYTIVRLLGLGGMGAVYQAWDKELEVVVALKVIRPETLRDPAAEQEIERRFKRELLLARQVTHKNVVRIYDLGELNGIKYITMSYVEGKELKALLKEAGRLPIDQTLKIMRQVISGLVAAHKAGVVHRDLKPANIMIGNKSGDALIMDFGIARSTSAPAEKGSEPGAQDIALAGIGATGKYTEATVFGSIVGTVEYMAPEQARGSAIDHRADIYTAGLILYDMLSGKARGQEHASALDRLRDRMEGKVEPLKTVAPDVPDALVAVVTRAIEPDAAKRFQSTEEFAEALDRLDDQGVPKPIKRAVSLRVAAAGVLLLLGLSVGTYYFTKTPDAQPTEPVSMIIADFENRSGDQAFTRTLEPNLRRAFEGAGFITAYDRVGTRRTLGTMPPEKFDEAAAREIALKQGLSVVLSGVVEKQGSRYRVSMKATRPFDGEVISDVSSRASTAADVLPTAMRLVGSVREKLGDQTTETPNDILMKQRSLSTSSVEVLRYYGAAQSATAENKWEDARQNLLKAVEIDPNFGLGYLLLSGVSRNLGKRQEADQYIKQALDHVGDMTERERLTTRGLYFRLTLDYENCVKQQEQLIQNYSADVIGHNGLAICYSQLRDLPKAKQAMQKIVQILPKHAVFRDNLALYSNYSGDFSTGEEQALKAIELVPSKPERATLVPTDDAYAMVALAFAQMGQGKLADANNSFTRLAHVPGQGPTFSASGLGDLAAYEGRYAEAVKLIEQGAAADLAAKSPAPAAAKYIELAYVQQLRGQKAAAVAAAEKALASSKIMKVRFIAARIFIEAGQVAKATDLVTELVNDPQKEPQAYGHILQAMLTSRDAIKLATDANALRDTWIGHLELGRAYLAAGQFVQADSEFDICRKRIGEAVSLFLDEEPTFVYFPMVHVYQAQARERGKLPGAADSYRAYLAIREKAGEDPLIADLRKRAAAK